MNQSYLELYLALFFKYTRSKIIGTVLISIVSACANITAPTGGPQDKTPPKLMGTIPKNNSTLFKENKFYFEFDENIQENQTAKNIYISPFVEKFSFKIKKNILMIEIGDSLQNGTYKIAVLGGVKDLTENNVLNEAVLAFSNTDQIDSLQIRGKASDFWTGKAYDKSKILLYPENTPVDTIATGKAKPIYVTSTGKDGSYSFSNLPSKKFRVVGLAEERENLKYDNEKEKIGLLTGLQMPQVFKDSSSGMTEIRLLEYPKKEFCTQDRSRGKTELKNTYCSAVENVEVRQIHGPKNLSYCYRENQVGVFNLGEKDTFSVIVTAADYWGFTNIDTLSGWLDKSSAFNDFGKEEYKKLYLKPDDAKGALPGKIEKIKIYFPVPIADFDTAKVRLLAQDSTTALKNISFSDSFNYAIIETLPAKKYLLKVSDSAAVYTNGKYSVEKENTYEQISEDKTGAIMGKIEAKNYNGSFILEVIEQDKETETSERVLKTTKPDFKVAMLKPGNKKLKLVLDANNNGKWDRGKASPFEKPEKVFFYDKPLVIKANWEIDKLLFSVE